MNNLEEVDPERRGPHLPPEDVPARASASRSPARRCTSCSPSSCSSCSSCSSARPDGERWQVGDVTPGQRRRGRRAARRRRDRRVDGVGCPASTTSVDELAGGRSGTVDARASCATARPSPSPSSCPRGSRSIGTVARGPRRHRRRRRATSVLGEPAPDECRAGRRDRRWHDAARDQRCARDRRSRTCSERSRRRRRSTLGRRRRPARRAPTRSTSASRPRRRSAAFVGVGASPVMERVDPRCRPASVETFGEVIVDDQSAASASSSAAEPAVVRGVTPSAVVAVTRPTSRRAGLDAEWQRDRDRCRSSASSGSVRTCRRRTCRTWSCSSASAEHLPRHLQPDPAAAVRRRPRRDRRLREDPGAASPQHAAVPRRRLTHAARSPTAWSRCWSSSDCCDVRRPHLDGVSLDPRPVDADRTSAAPAAQIRAVRSDPWTLVN